MSKLYMAFVLLALASSCTTHAQLTTRTVRENLFIPWEMIYAPDNKIWFTQKNGYICRLDPVSSQLDTLYRETAVVIQGEGGMTGMALHPQFPAQPYVYVAHNYTAGSTYKIRIVRYTYNGSNALGSMQIVLDNINGSYNHNGTRLVADGDKLFITTGDAEVPSIAQNSSALNGKVLRINLDGTIPADNPTTGSAVWSKGHRNAQGLVMANGILYSSEHGPSNDDEVNIIKKGRNFGWPNVHGYCNTPAEVTFCNDSNVVTPLMAWTPTLAVCGMAYYNHSIFPQWNHSLLMTTLKDQHLYVLKLNAAGDSITSSTVVSNVNFGRLRDVCVSPAGKVYISTSMSAASGTGAHTDKIIELSDPSVNVRTQTMIDLKVYPNPVTNLLNVQLPGHIIGRYKIYDLKGSILREGKIDASQVIVDVSQLPADIYHLEVLDEKSNFGHIPFVKLK